MDIIHTCGLKEIIFDAKLGTDAACVACPALLMWISAPGASLPQDTLRTQYQGLHSTNLRGWLLNIDKAMASGVRSKILEHQKSTLSLQQQNLNL